MSDVFRVLCQIIDNDSTKSSLILKSVTQIKGFDPILPIWDMFQRENLVYNKVILSKVLIFQIAFGLNRKYNCFFYQILKNFEDLQLSKGIDISENGFHEYANCYYSSNKEFSECFFLEDLRNSHFTMLNHRTEAVTFDHVALAMKTLGKFHALSFALRDQHPQRFNFSIFFFWFSSFLSFSFIHTQQPYQILL